ncbi:MAG: epoxide hydrolase family protein [Terracidiphilus sp.]
MDPHQFTIDIPQTALDDLRERLSRTRWLKKSDNDGWTFGLEIGYLKDLVSYWQDGYDWRQQETTLNRFKHFHAVVDGIKIHYVHARGTDSAPTPLLLLHGFPDSFYRYHKVIERLANPGKHGANPELAFDVVVASIPGTGFSDPVALDCEANADLFAKLMTETLGYSKFIAAGGDHGAIITQALARKHPEALLGIHLTDVGYPDTRTDYSSLSPAEIQMAQWVQRWFMEDGIGVNMIMATKPQTLAYALNDSPAGLAAWLISYSSSGEKGREEFKSRFSHDEVLTNVMIYWLTETIHSAARSYFANARLMQKGGTVATSTVPAAVAHCPYDPPLPKEWAARRVNLIRFTEFPRGGHFMAWEEPELFADDLREFGRELKQPTGK